MKNFEANEETPTPLCCLMCEREIPDRNWFARIKLGNRRVAFCRPWCMEVYLDSPEKYTLRLESSLSELTLLDGDLLRKRPLEQSETQQSDARIIANVSSGLQLSGARARILNFGLTSL